MPCFEILTSLEHDADFPYWTKVQYTALTVFAREILTPTGVG
jgi:hypothetical protein